ncbi:MAG: hypothetical protein R2799_15875 [Crocinitomicaceae bacterium]
MKTLFSLSLFALILVACNSEEPKSDATQTTQDEDTLAVDSSW